MEARGPYAKSAKRRNAILTAAFLEFAIYGSRGSLDDIARQAGVTRAMLAYHYPAKGALFAAVLKRRDELECELFPLEGGDPVESLRVVVRHVEYGLSMPGMIALHLATSVDALADRAVRQYHIERQAAALGCLTGILERCRDRRLLSPSVEPARAARAIIALRDGLQVQWLTAPDRVDVVGDLVRYIGSLLTPDARWPV